jgi:hypothetical protein
MNPKDEARHIGVVPAWLDQRGAYGGSVNPGSGVTVCDSGGLPSGYWDVYWFVYTNCALGAGNLDFQWRTADNSGTIWGIPFFSDLGLSTSGRLEGLRLHADERFRLIVSVGFTGTVGGAILAIRRA